MGVKKEVLYGEGELKDFPVAIINKMLQHQVAQGNIGDVSVFENKPDADCKRKGFDWDNTPEEYTFWNDVIRYRDFDVFFNRYPKSSDVSKYKGELTDIPSEIVEKMLYYQEQQGNPRKVSVFEVSVECSFLNEGFDWDRTLEGYDFWYNVLTKKQFEKFFSKYPKTPFPVKWYIQGDRTDQNLIPESHWFYPIVRMIKLSGSMSFSKTYYYSNFGIAGRRDKSYYIKKGAVLVTKEQLINHYLKPKTSKDEVSRKNQEQGTTGRQGTRATCEKIKIASASRPVGSGITNLRKRSRARITSIEGRRLQFD